MKDKGITVIGRIKIRAGIDEEFNILVPHHKNLDKCITSTPPSRC